jgi:hypothetical protein
VVHGPKINYCMSERTLPKCRLEVSVYILVAVIVCNIIKSAAMFWTLPRQRETTFVTLEDAISSWLDRPDETTIHRCLMSKKDVLQSFKRSSSSASENDTPLPMPFSLRQRQRWYKAVSPKRWAVSMASCIATIAAVIELFCVALSDENVSQTPNPLIALGFGSFSPNAIIQIGIPHRARRMCAIGQLTAGHLVLLIPHVQRLIHQHAHGARIRRLCDPAQAATRDYPERLPALDILVAAAVLLRRATHASVRNSPLADLSVDLPRASLRLDQRRPTRQRTRQHCIGRGLQPRADFVHHSARLLHDDRRGGDKF